jgi:hypothetical protein
MPGVAARAAMAPRDHRIAPEHLLHTDVMSISAIGAHVRYAGFLELAGRPHLSLFFGRHVEVKHTMRDSRRHFEVFPEIDMSEIEPTAGTNAVEVWQCASKTC